MSEEIAIIAVAQTPSYRAYLDPGAQILAGQQQQQRAAANQNRFFVGT